MRVTAAIFLACFLLACSSEAPPPEGADAEMDEYALEYQERVRKKVSGSIVSSLAEDWDIPEDQVRCLLQGVPLDRFEFAQSDPEVQAVFEDCGVDPAIIQQ